jgi:transposase
MEENGVLPKRWRVERIFAWANWSRVLSKDYEIKAVYQENALMISYLHTLLKRY